MRFAVPKELGIGSITVDRDRAEVTDVTIGWINDDGIPVHDGDITPDQHDNNRYTIHHPDKFVARRNPFYLFVDGTWRWGGTRGQTLSKMTTDYYADRIVVALWTGNAEPSNTRVIFHLDGHIKSTLVD